MVTQYQMQATYRFYIKELMEKISHFIDGKTYSSSNSIEIGAGESWYAKLTNTTVGNLYTNNQIYIFNE